MKLSITIAFLILSSTFINNAQQKKSGLKEPIIYEWADSMAGTSPQGQKIRDWEGNVRFRQKDVRVKSDFARQYLETNKLDLIGNVRITQDSLIMTAPKIFYDGNTKLADAKDGVKIINGNTTLTAQNGKYSTDTKIAVFTGNVLIDDDSATITADKIIYHKENQNSFAYGNVTIRGKFTNTILNADTILHYPETYYTEAMGKPLFTQIDTIKKSKVTIPDSASPEIKIEFDTLTIISEIMETFRSEHVETYTFIDSVVMLKGSISARANQAFYDKFEEIIYLYDVPIVWFESTQLHADSIMIHIPNKKLSMIHALRNSLAATSDDSLTIDMISQITGDEIIINFENDNIDFIHSFGNAKSLFFDKDDSDEYNAARISSDTINIIFEYGDPSKLIGLSGVNSEYFPEDMILHKTKDLYLPRFRWSEDKPKKILLKR